MPPPDGTMPAATLAASSFGLIAVAPVLYTAAQISIAEAVEMLT
jgi:hypothetical protein